MANLFLRFISSNCLRCASRFCAAAIAAADFFVVPDALADCSEVVFVFAALAGIGRLVNLAPCGGFCFSCSGFYMIKTKKKNKNQKNL